MILRNVIRQEKQRKCKIVPSNEPKLKNGLRPSFIHCDCGLAFNELFGICPACKGTGERNYPFNMDSKDKTFDYKMRQNGPETIDYSKRRRWL